MTLDASILAPALEHLKEGAFGVRIREAEGEVLIERTDPVLDVDGVADYLHFSASTVRAMERKHLLHALKSKGIGGALRFRKSRLVADMARMERL